VTRTPRRWPATNTDRIVRHVARQFPELSRRQVSAAVNATFLAIRDSLVAQVREGAQNPHVRLYNLGSFEMRLYKPVRRPGLSGEDRVIPARWKVVFRPGQNWRSAVADVTRTTVQGDTGENPSLESSECPLPDEETPRDLPDLPSGGRP
jgi:nucleoid DNA-binding protein